MHKKDFVKIVVLNDGETFSDVKGCSIRVIPIDEYERVFISGGDARDFNPIAEIVLDDMTVDEDD